MNSISSAGHFRIYVPVLTNFFRRISTRYLATAAVMLAAACFSPANAALLKGIPVSLKQPDGRVIRCYATGDEYRNYLHDKDGYVTVQNPQTGFWVYARQINGRIRPSSHVVGRARPDIAGLSRGMELLSRGNADRVFEPSLILSPGSPGGPVPASPSQALAASGYPLTSPTRGAFNNIAILVRFADDPEFTNPISDFSSLFNASGDGAVSLYSYFREASYNQLSVSTFLLPGTGNAVISYKDDQPRAFYQPYDAANNPLGYRNSADYATRERALLDNSVTAVGAQVPGSVEVDMNGDGFVDNVCLIIRGNPDGWASLLWPHQSIAVNSTARIHGKRIGAYNVQIEAILLPDFVGVLCHEFFHSLGSPDLYRYSQAVGDWFDSVGPWDLMASPARVPQHMSAYMKYRYGGWLALPPLISRDGTYSLNPLTTATNNAFRIASPNSTAEWFMVEYRKKVGVFEQSLPEEGMLVYRVNAARDSFGDVSGPPDEVYVYRSAGTIFTNGSPSDACFSAVTGRTALSDTSDPPAFLSNGGSGGLLISAVSSPGEQISFQVAIQAGGRNSSVPAVPSGPIQGKANTQYQFSTAGPADSQGNALQYRFYWDDGIFSEWSSSPAVSYTFFGSRSYHVKVQARYAGLPGSYSDWSAPFLVSIDFETPLPFYMKQRLPAPEDSRMMIYSMATGDVDGDGKPEVVVMYAYLPTNFAKDRLQDLAVYGWQDGQLRKKWDRYGSSLSYPEGWKVLVADVDGDGRAEILKNGEMIKFASGKYDSIPMPIIPLAIGDANNDGIVEVVAFDGSLYQYRAGTWISSGHFEAPENISIVAIGDADGDGLNEVVVAAGNGRNTGSVTVLRSRSGGEFSVLWQKAQWMNVFTDCKIADWDSDGKEEIILANDEDSSVRVLKYANSTYSEVWSHNFYAYTGMGWVPTVALGRFNPASTANDLIIGLGGHCAQPAEGSGVYLEKVGMLFHDSDKSMGVGSLLLMDIDGDGQQDIIAGSTDGYIYIMSASHIAPVTPTPISPSGTAAFSTQGPEGDLIAGYASVSVNTGSSPYGTAVFSYMQDGIVVSEAGVPASPPTLAARFFVDTRNNVVTGPATGTISILTGFAAVNVSTAAATLNMMLRDTDGRTLAQGGIRMSPGEHIARFLDQMAPEFILPAGFISNGLGSMEITSDQPVSILALRLTINQRDELLLTSTPVADLAREVPAAGISFPQIADGGGYQTTLILMNTSSVTETGVVQFYGNGGAALTLKTTNGGASVTGLHYSIPAGGIYRAVTDGSPQTVNVGWAQLIPDAGKAMPVSAAVFGFTKGGVLVTESGVSAASGTTHARIYVDRSGGHDTGLAVANPGTAGIRITAKAYLPDGITAAGSGEVALDPKGHDSRFAEEIISGLPAGFTGVLDLSSTSPFTVLTLRSLTNGRGDFLVTTFPTADVMQPAPNPILFPHIANGGGYETQIILMGTSGSASTVTLRYLGNDGTPIAVAK